LADLLLIEIITNGWGWNTWYSNCVYCSSDISVYVWYSV